MLRRFKNFTIALMVSSTTAFIATLCIAIGWHLNGGAILSVQTGSMMPVLHPGDAIIVRPVKINQLQPGDIVSYRSLQNPKVSVTHRLVAFDGNGKLLVKGDQLAQPDPVVPARAVIGRVGWYLPYAGHLINLLTHPLGIILAVYLPAMLIVSLETNNFVRRYSSHYYRLSF